MGAGAFVQIANSSNQTVEVGYWNINCMYRGGEDGSDFGPITGTIAPGASLPAGGAQYIECISSGECALDSSTFNMNFNVYTPAKQSATFEFQERVGIISLPDGNMYAAQDVAGLRFSVTIAVDGDQQRITALVINI